jgi:membrane associated rhomboid family serine protease/Flp pilus assembly protein TadD
MAKCAQCGRNLPTFSFGKRICQWCVEYQAAQRGEISEDAVQRVMPAPWVRGGTDRMVTQAIFGINLAVFAAMVLAGVSVTDPTTQELIHWGANSAQLTLGGQWWRLVTNTFLHIGFIHIALNMWCLWSLGALAESLYGPWTYAAVYLISGVSGSLASIAWHPYGVSAGASGAIFGLAGALIASYKLGEFSLPPSVVAGTLRCTVAFVGYNLVFGMMSGRTDNAAHLGGLAGGALMGALIARFAPQRDAFASRVAMVALGFAALLGAGFWVNQAQGYDVRVNKANELIGKNQAAVAVVQLQEIIHRRPKLASAHFALAHAYFNLRQYPQAESELKRVIELQPQDGWASYELGMTYINEKRFAEAKEVFTRRLGQNTNDANAHFGLGLALANEHDYEAAIQHYNTAIRLDPQSEDVYYEIGNSYVQLKKYDEAIAAFSKEQEANGDNAYIETALADVYKAQGMQQKADDAQHKAEQLRKTQNQNDSRND